ncbi:hypothetical protein N7523_006128 [Penicillium sp. IBT 18751x]|nr:hypothetical protein N7523_006128 [Penicillium sp. IBT 18751x]
MYVDLELQLVRNALATTVDIAVAYVNYVLQEQWGFSLEDLSTGNPYICHVTVKTVLVLS